jgi:DNA-binding LytR/AlgR family response regulator
MADELLNELLTEIKTLRQEQTGVLKRLEFVGKPLFVQDGDKKKVLRTDEISFITTNPKGLDIYSTDGNKHINFSSITETDEELKDDPRFMKTHKSFIVNLNQIDTVKVESGRELTFKGHPAELTAKVTQDYLEEFDKRFGKS